MKKLFSCVLLVLLLVGCADKTAVTPVTENLSFNTRLCYFNECYEAAATIDSSGSMTFNITSPDELNGLTLMFSGDKMTASFAGVEYTEQNPQLTSAFGRVNKIFTDIREKNQKVFEDDNRFYTEGTVDGCEYELTVSTSGIPIELEADCGDLEMSFTDVKITQ